MESVATNPPIHAGENDLNQLRTFYQNQQQYAYSGRDREALHVNNILCWYGVSGYQPTHQCWRKLSKYVENLSSKSTTIQWWERQGSTTYFAGMESRATNPCWRIWSKFVENTHFSFYQFRMLVVRVGGLKQSKICCQTRFCSDYSGRWFCIDFVGRWLNVCWRCTILIRGCRFSNNSDPRVLSIAAPREINWTKGNHNDLQDFPPHSFPQTPF